MWYKRITKQKNKLRSVKFHAKNEMGTGKNEKRENSQHLILDK